MILAQCQLIYQNLTVATYRLYFDTDYQVIDEFFVTSIKNYPQHHPLPTFCIQV